MSKGYDRDSYSSPSSSGFSSGSTSSSKAKKVMSRTRAHKDTSPLNRSIVSGARHSIRLVFDNTGSNEELMNILYDKAPSLWGQVMYPGKMIEEIRKIEKGLEICDVDPYLRDYDMSINCNGDAYSDEDPHQIGDFVRGDGLEKWMPKFWKECGGGGGMRESYELDAYFDLHHVQISKKGMSFYIPVVDEAPYPYVDKDIVQKVFGDKIKKNIPTEEIYADLFRKYNGNVFILLNPYFGRCSDGSERHPTETKAIMKRWIEVVGPEYADHIIRIYQEKSVIDIILGIIARVSGARDKAGYTRDMETKGQDAERIRLVNKSLAFLDIGKAKSGNLPKAKKSDLPKTKTKKTSGGGKRL